MMGIKVTGIILSAALVCAALLGISEVEQRDDDNGKGTNTERLVNSKDLQPIPAWLEKGIAWLAEAQFENGGWGAGSHSHQQIRDPLAVQVDPATTAYSAIALIRSGSTLEAGPYHQNVKRALDYLLNLVETAPKDGNRISNISGTQPQAKLGQNIDVSICLQFFTRVLPLAKSNDTLSGRLATAIDICISKLQKAQSSDGSWTDQGWAPVLQSAAANSALEMAAASGARVDDEALERSRDYQKKNIDASGSVTTDAAAGVSLYSISSNQRANAKQAREAEEIIARARKEGKLKPSDVVSEDNLRRSGIDKSKAEKLAAGYAQSEIVKDKIYDDSVLAGFGNNGGEEYLSYMMSSEALVMAGGKEWQDWRSKMSGRFEKVQNPGGSWSGHHCITSPVFCTAGVILTMTADRDREFLLQEKK